MSVTVTQGNLFESDAHCLVNTVNTVGVMGKGIALEFKTRYPTMFEDYCLRCRSKQVKLGQPYLFSALEPWEGPWVINFPTKGHWRDHSNLKYIMEGLEHLERNIKSWGVESLAVPALGCGEGGLRWITVGPVLKSYLSRLEIPVTLYRPPGEVGP